jgi:hypothetical protein
MNVAGFFLFPGNPKVFAVKTHRKPSFRYSQFQESHERRYFLCGQIYFLALSGAFPPSSAFSPLNLL